MYDYWNKISQDNKAKANLEAEWERIRLSVCERVWGRTLKIPADNDSVILYSRVKVKIK